MYVLRRPRKSFYRYFLRSLAWQVGQNLSALTDGRQCASARGKHCLDLGGALAPKSRPTDVRNADESFVALTEDETAPGEPPSSLSSTILNLIVGAGRIEARQDGQDGQSGAQGGQASQDGKSGGETSQSASSSASSSVESSSASTSASKYHFIYLA